MIIWTGKQIFVGFISAYNTTVVNIQQCAIRERYQLPGLLSGTIFQNISVLQPTNTALNVASRVKTYY